MDLTMLRQMSRRARLDAMLSDATADESHELARLLKSAYGIVDAPNTSLKPSDIATILMKAPKLEDTEYTALLYYLQSTGRPHRAFNNFPHPPNALILPPQAERPYQVKHGQHTFSCRQSHLGNSAIQFYNPLTQAHDTGFIQTIYQLPLGGSMQTFIVVCPHQPLPPVEEQKAPFHNHPGFMTRIVDALPSDGLVIIEPTHIVIHLTTFSRPKGTYGIDQETMVICWALNRGRR